jgi:maleate cis-trans isomerase
MNSTLLLPGWRARIGVISPTVLERIPLDFQRIAPEGAMLCGVTCGMGGWAADQYAAALAQVKDAAAYLARRKVDFVLHVASPIVVAQGPGADRALLADLAAATGGIPCTTTIRAALDAFALLGARRVIAVTPFHAVLNGQLRAYVEAEGVAIAHLAAVPASFDFLQDVAPDALFRAALAAAAEAPDFDCVWIPSGQLPAVEVVKPLEARLGKPVVAQNHADFLAAFRALRLTGIARGHGMLLDRVAEGA